MSEMSKRIVVGMLVVVAALGATPAQAQTEMPKVAGLTPFTQQANYMSLPGYLRFQHLLKTGQWLSHEAAVQAVRDQGVVASWEADGPGWLLSQRPARRDTGRGAGCEIDLAVGRSLSEAVISPRLRRAL
jgi:hypothetical protein